MAGNSGPTAKSSRLDSERQSLISSFQREGDTPSVSFVGSGTNQREDDSPSLTDILSGYKIGLKQNRDTLRYEIDQHTEFTGCEGSIGCFDVTYTIRNGGDRVELKNEVTRYCVCSECRKEWFERKSGNQAKEQKRDTLRDKIEQHTELTGCEGSITCFDVTYTKTNEGECVELENEVKKYYVCIECRKEWFKRKSGDQAEELNRDPLLDEISQHTKLTGCGGSISYFNVTYTKRNGRDPVELKNELTKYYVCSECRKEWLKWKSEDREKKKRNRVTPLDENEQHTQLTGCTGTISCFDVTYTQRNGGDPVELKNEPTKYYVCSECRKEWFKCKSEDREVKVTSQPHYFSSQLCCLVPSDAGTLANNCCWGKVQDKKSATRLKAGDHVAWVRCCGYWHHGIVEYTDNNTLHLIEFSLSCRLCKIDRSEQSMLSICSPMYKAYYTEGLLHQNPPELVIVRAVSRLGEKGYNLLTNNCEHFATFCKTGVYRSDQIYQTQIGLQSLILKSFILLIRLAVFVAVTEIVEAAHGDSEQTHNSTQVNNLSGTQVDVPYSINTLDIIEAAVYIFLEIVYLFVALGLTWCIDTPQLYNLQMGWPKCCGCCRKVKYLNPCGKATTRIVLHTMCVIAGVVSFSVFLKAHLERKNGRWSNVLGIFKEIGLGVAGGFSGSILGFLLFTFCPSVHCCFHRCKCCCRASHANAEDTQVINQSTSSC